MDSTPSRLKLLGVLAAAIATLCLGFTLSLQFGTEGAGARAGMFVLRLLVLLAFVMVAIPVFEIGQQRGFAVRDEEGHVSLTNIARNLVASCIAFGLVVLAASPFIGAIFQVTR